MPITDRPKQRMRSLTAQMILSFVVLVLISASASGLPAIIQLRNQLERQAWAQIEQGSRAAQALYAAQINEITNLANLTAQRPTLIELLNENDSSALNTYLGALQAGTSLDLILICNLENETVAIAGRLPPVDLCKGELPESSLQAWITASAPIQERTEVYGTVISGLMLGDDFAEIMQTQTGLEYTLFIDGDQVATSMKNAGIKRTHSTKTEGQFNTSGRTYYFSRTKLSDPDLEAELALDVTNIVATKQRLIWALAAGILAVAAFASLVGVLLARRISRPLARLADAATTLKNGDVSRPVEIESPLKEVALVAQALEGARKDLRTTLAELRHEKAWTDHLLEAIVEGIVTLDRHGHITFFSHGAERITGWSRQQVLGRVCDQVFLLTESDQPFSEVIPSPGQKRKLSVMLAGDRPAILALTGARLAPFEDGGARVALVFRDVSEEEAFRRLMAHFLANVSHEFRTPLSALAASVELLMDQAADLSQEELEELLVAIHLGVLGLHTLVDNLLESASIEAGRFRVSLRQSNLSDIIGEAVGLMQPLLDKHGQQLMVELPADLPVVQADPRRLVQVLVNLLSNASKYGPDNSEIAICVRPEGKTVRVSVADQGKGIPPDQKADLFRRFIHPSTANDKAKYGIGLGLSVVKAVVEAHSGQVGVDGAVFWFTIPLVANNEKAWKELTGDLLEQEQ